MPGRRTLRLLVEDGDETSCAEVERSLRAAGISAEVLETRDGLQEDRLELLGRERAARQEAEAATCARDEFLATISHELRTPLNAILGWARLIVAGDLDPEAVVRAATIIERNARSQVQVIEDLLEMSRLVTGRLTLDVRVTPIASLLQAAVDAIGPATQAKEITVDVDASRAPGVIACDVERVQQILWNFLSNAVKFTPRGGRISVVARANHTISIDVCDTGVGIKPQFLPYVFDRFTQQEAATTRTRGGLGIGLAIAKHLAELHGGSVRASSPGEGQGSTFTVTLPRSLEPVNSAG